MSAEADERERSTPRNSPIGEVIKDRLEAIEGKVDQVIGHLESIEARLLLNGDNAARRLGDSSDFGDHSDYRSASRANRTDAPLGLLHDGYDKTRASSYVPRGT